MADDPWRVLGLRPGAGIEAVRAAFRAIARASHPDRNPGDAAAEARFRAAAAAWEILRTAHEATEAPREAGVPRGATPAARGGGFRDFADFLARRPAREPARAPTPEGPPTSAPPRPVALGLELGFLDAARGGPRRLVLPGGREAALDLPPGIEDGEVLRQTLALPGGPVALVLTLSVRPHRHFRREGDDIRCDLPVTIDEAVLGARIEVPTPEGRVALAVPRGAAGGLVLRLRGKGICQRGGGGRGDFFATLRIVPPPGGDRALEGFLADWRRARHDDPRQGLG